MERIFNQLTQPLLKWYHQNRRALPWRDDPTPYHVWISEIMLQQTRVEAVKEYYTRFLSHFPDIDALADADERTLSKCWEGLGYYSRMRNLARCAKLLRDTYDSALPDTYEQLLTLPGIGSYTAGAIASIAFGQKVPAVDGNVLRVMSRIFASDVPIDLPKTKNFWFDALLHTMPDSPGDFNQALMELGATVCLPNGKPHCDICPVKESCLSAANGNPTAYPVKKPKKARRIEQRTFLLISTPNGQFLLHKRPSSGLLASLWEYPNTPGHLTPKEVADALAQRQIPVLSITPLPEKKHIFTHIEWQILGYHIRTDKLLPAEDEVLANDGEIQAIYALPSAFDQYNRKEL